VAWRIAHKKLKREERTEERGTEGEARDSVVYSSWQDGGAWEGGGGGGEEWK
jgi:hypothetical protein